MLTEQTSQSSAWQSEAGLPEIQFLELWVYALPAVENPQTIIASKPLRQSVPALAYFPATSTEQERVPSNR